MSLSELVSFAVSGSAASAVSALLTDRVSPEERRGRPRQRGRGDEAVDLSAHPKSTGTRSAANGLIFFFTYYVAATAQYTGNAAPAEKKTHRAAKDAFLVGATASVFTRLFGFVAGPERPAGNRWSLPALEDDAVLAIDPGLTFCVHEVLARSVARYLSRRRQRAHSRVHTEVVAAVTTFVLAAASKLVATSLTYPFHAAAAEATEQRWRATLTREDEDDDAPLIFLGDEEEHHYSRRPRPHRREKTPSKRQHNVLAVLLQMLRSGGVGSVYADWLRSVLTAALGHGLTMALQRSIYGYILQFVLSVVSQRRASPSPTTATAPATRQIEPPAQPHPISEATAKVKNAVETWLETSSVASKGTVDVDDSISNVTSRVSTRVSRPPQPTPTRRQPPPQTSNYQRRPREVAGLASSRASEPTAFYPDAIAAGRRLQLLQQQRQPPTPRPSTKGRDFGDFDDDGSLIFNMVSKSPRVINGRREGS